MQCNTDSTRQYNTDSTRQHNTMQTVQDNTILIKSDQSKYICSFLPPDNFEDFQCSFLSVILSFRTVKCILLYIDQSTVCKIKVIKNLSKYQHTAAIKCNSKLLTLEYNKTSKKPYKGEVTISKSTKI